MIKQKLPHSACTCELCEIGRKYYQIIDKMEPDDKKWMHDFYEVQLNSIHDDTDAFNNGYKKAIYDYNQDQLISWPGKAILIIGIIVGAMFYGRYTSRNNTQGDLRYELGKKAALDTVISILDEANKRDTLHVTDLEIRSRKHKKYVLTPKTIK